MNNTEYFREKLTLVVRDLSHYTPQEMARELVRLAKVADETEAVKEAALAYQASNGAVPEGYVLMPRNPSESILRPDGFDYRLRFDQYQAMLDVAEKRQPKMVVRCGHCTPEGVFADDGSGPFDCYACGKKAAAPSPAQPAPVSEVAKYDPNNPEDTTYTN